MTQYYVATVALHVLAAVVWLGGMLFFAVAAPVLRGVEDDRLRAALFDGIGRRFRVVGWTCIAMLLVTGIEQLRLRGWWGGDFWIGPRAGHATPGTPEARTLRLRAARSARVNALLAVALVYAAVRLTR